MCWSTQRAAALGLDARRVTRWTRRRATADRGDQRPGRDPVPAILPAEQRVILALVDGWGEIDRSPAPYLPRATAAAMASVTPPPSRGPSSLSEPPASPAATSLMLPYATVNTLVPLLSFDTSACCAHTRVPDGLRKLRCGSPRDQIAAVPGR